VQLDVDETLADAKLCFDRHIDVLARRQTDHDERGPPFIEGRQAEVEGRGFEQHVLLLATFARSAMASRRADGAGNQDGGPAV
jgi:hypothetical protein